MTRSRTFRARRRTWSRTSRTCPKDQADVNKQQRELNTAQGDLTAARAEYHDAGKQRLAKIDDEIHQIEMKTDASARTRQPNCGRGATSWPPSSMRSALRPRTTGTASRRTSTIGSSKLESDASDALKK